MAEGIKQGDYGRIHQVPRWGDILDVLVPSQAANMATKITIKDHM